MKQFGTTCFSFSNVGEIDCFYTFMRIIYIFNFRKILAYLEIFRRFAQKLMLLYYIIGFSILWWPWSKGMYGTDAGVKPSGNNKLFGELCYLLYFWRQVQETVLRSVLQSMWGRGWSPTSSKICYHAHGQNAIARRYLTHNNH